MSDVWLPPDEDPRYRPSRRAASATWCSATCASTGRPSSSSSQGLDAEQLARRSVPPSTMSLLGLLRHLAAVEHSWNKRVLQGHMELIRLYRDHPEDRDRDFNGAVADDDVVAEAWASWRQEVADAEAWLEDDDFARLVPLDDQEIEVRDIVVHLVEEYARHCGHADLLRECIDGRTGQ